MAKMNTIFMNLFVTTLLLLHSFVDAFGSNEGRRLSTQSIRRHNEFIPRNSVAQRSQTLQGEKVTGSHTSKQIDRRHWLKFSIATTIGWTAWSGNVAPSNAACLSGDTRECCIGMYKLPLDDQVASFIDTPEVRCKNGAVKKTKKNFCS